MRRIIFSLILFIVLTSLNHVFAQNSVNLQHNSKVINVENIFSSYRDKLFLVGTSQPGDTHWLKSRQSASIADDFAWERRAYPPRPPDRSSPKGLSNGDSIYGSLPHSVQNTSRGTVSPTPSNNHSFPSGDTVQQEWVAHYGSNLFHSQDGPNDMVVDTSDGSVIVTGTSPTAYTNTDFVTIKYSATGEMVWFRRYEGHVPSAEAVSNDIAIDKMGNVYVSGMSGSYFVTIKYDRNGIEQWVRPYLTPGCRGQSYPYLAIDAQGNVFIAGAASFELEYFILTDYVIIKYDNTGTLQWTRRYDGPDHWSDNPVAIEPTSQGGVYVTGFSGGIGTNYDIATIKYNTDGEQIWVARYNRTGTSYEWATSMAIDRYDNVVVTGSSGLSFVNDHTYETVTIKYSNSGIQQWANVYDGPDHDYESPYDIAVDHASNTYVTSVSLSIASYLDYATTKYDSVGNEVWTMRYNGDGNSADRPAGITVDSIGNSYVTGSSVGTDNLTDITTIAYSPDGTERWVARFDGNGGKVIGLDKTGDLYVAGTSYGIETYDDFRTIKYDNTANLKWHAHYDGPGYTCDEVSASTIDKSGNVYVTGFSRRDFILGGYTTVKYDHSGRLQWATRYDAGENTTCRPIAIAVDIPGNVYVTGVTYGESGPDYTTVKYNNTGEELWAGRYSSPGTSQDYPAGMAIDSLGNVYVTGSSRTIDETGYGPVDYLTVKYSPEGIEQWVARYDGPGNSLDQAAAIAVDPTGNVIVSGTRWPYDSTSVALTLKYDSAGTLLWTASHRGSSMKSAYASCLKIDETGHIIISGKVGEWPEHDFLLIRYSSSGTEEWAVEYDGDGYDESTALSTDRFGNILVSGNSTILSYDESGHLNWVSWFGDAGVNYDASDLCIDESGNVYVTGEGTIANSIEFVTIKYDKDGQPIWLHHYGGDWGLPNFVRNVRVHQNGNVFVAGTSQVPLIYTFTVVKLNQNLPIFSTDQDVILFDDTRISCHTTRSIIITNHGVKPLDVSNVVTDNADFAVTALGGNILEGESKELDIIFTPSTTGVKSGHIIFHHNGENSPDTIIVSGTAFGEGEFVSTSPSFSTGWNLISQPVVTECPWSFASLFEFTQGYLQRDTLVPGIGYWTKLGEGQLTFTGTAITQDTIDIRRGWNLIGSISIPVPVEVVQSIPGGIITTQLFGYTGDQYFEADTIQSGRAYWIKVNDDGKLILSSSVEAHSASAIRITPTDELPPPPPHSETELSSNSEINHFFLHQNYPNPFNPLTKISYSLPETKHVTLTIFDVLGQKVAILVDEVRESGSYTAQWNAARLASGIYYYRLQAGSYIETKKLLLLK